MNRLTRIIGSFRYPQSTWGKALQRLIPILFFILLFISILSGIIVFQILVPSKLPETINPASFLMTGFHSLPFDSGKNHFEGWLIPSVRNAPVIILCHGYKSNRSEVLTLAATLQENGYNLFLYDMRGHGENPLKVTTLGFQETVDLQAAVQMLSGQPGLDPKRMGIYGVGMGAFVALTTAVQSSQIKALVIDSTFENPYLYMEMQTRNITGIDSFILKRFCDLGLWLVNLPQPGSTHSSLGNSLQLLAGRPKLFISNDQEVNLRQQTMRFFERSPFPKELRQLKSSGTSLLYGLERKDYEILILDFFQRNLPIRQATPGEHLYQGVEGPPDAMNSPTH
jgi:pimeloyl-ACP methyl ester carboxylesterase